MEPFKPGIYRHWKGPLYRALFLAQESTNRVISHRTDATESTEEPLVVYVSLESGNVCVRSLEQWNELVPNPGYDTSKLGRPTVPRFEFVES